MTAHANSSASRPSGIALAIARYYADFLATDFKGARLPKRFCQRKTGKGLLVGTELARYPQLAARVHKALAGSSTNRLCIEARRGSYRTELPEIVRKVLDGTIEKITADQIEHLVIDVADKAKRLVTGGEMDVEIFRDVVMEKAVGLVNEALVAPVLESLSEHLKNAASRPAEDLQSLGRGLSERLLGDLPAVCIDALAEVVVKYDNTALRQVLQEHFELEGVKAVMKEFFEGFIASDLFVELVDMCRSQRMLENTEFFLYIGTVQVEGTTYPLAFQRLELTETQGGLELQADPQLYINAQAIDYAVEVACKAEDIEVGPSVVAERIHYLAAHSPAFEVLQPIVDAMALACSTRIDKPLAQEHSTVIARSPRITLGSHVSIALADKPDESILNDYEALGTGRNCDSASVEFFEEMVSDFLTGNPLSVHDRVERDWDETPLSDRLVFESPLPLAEEQRKILRAIDLAEARYIAVEGPPGTGKSHTITAIAFNAILKGQSLLILSDKREALDVVEDKLNEALAKVRHKEDFQNPILRLGRASGNYNRLMKKSTIEALEISRRMARHHEQRLRDERALELDYLKQALADSAEVLSQIELRAIDEVYALEQGLFADFPGLRDLTDAEVEQVLHDFNLVYPFLNSARDRLIALQARAGGSLDLLRRLRQLTDLLEQDKSLQATDLSLVATLRADQVPALKDAIAALDDAKGALGYLFAGKALRQVSRMLDTELGVTLEKPQHQRDTLMAIARTADALRERMTTRGLALDEFPLAYDMLRNGAIPMVPVEVMVSAERLEAAAEEGHPLLQLPKGATLLRSLLSLDDPALEPLRRYAFVHAKLDSLRQQFAALPQIDYLGAKTRIEGLYTQELAGVIDERLIRFYHHRRADAKTLGDVIRARGRFPADKFALLKEAFPCMIAGLREYAEFIPLERGLFDLVIIDEASQVSIAQALPAILRARKMVVLGDRKQFGNVKTALAGKAINNGHMEALRRAFSAIYGVENEYTRQRLERFNIKSSVMDFFDLVANYSIQLRKHFRSYPEMIGFSSQTFYDGSLQTMKIRGKPITDVIQFDAIEHDGKADPTGNTNEPEADRIIAQLEQLLVLDPPCSAGVITPHGEQVTLISRKVDAHPKADAFRTRLRLKVMTFDSCQGEERDVIFYSLVATREKDRLSHIFPASLDAAADDIEYNLRLQRLNVGFSRAKERIVIVHSKPIDEYRSAIKSALFYYRGAIERALRLPAANEVDSRSPMELKVLSWLSQAPLIQQLGDRVELHAQFPMGEYLRSLDPSYQHPAYRVDFLLRVVDGRDVRHLVVEYDGFEYHFDTGRRKDINHGNWQHYLTERDIERERVLESFGVKMIRLNRFVLRGTPVQVIDELLRERLRDLRDADGEHRLLEQTKHMTSIAETGLSAGTHKHCRKCDQVKPMADFTSAGAKSGYGRLCTKCRT